MLWLSDWGSPSHWASFLHLQGPSRARHNGRDACSIHGRQSLARARWSGAPASCACSATSHAGCRGAEIGPAWSGLRAKSIRVASSAGYGAACAWPSARAFVKKQTSGRPITCSRWHAFCQERPPNRPPAGAPPSIRALGAPQPTARLAARRRPQDASQQARGAAGERSIAECHASGGQERASRARRPCCGAAAFGTPVLDVWRRAHASAPPGRLWSHSVQVVLDGRRHAVQVPCLRQARSSIAAAAQSGLGACIVLEMLSCKLFSFGKAWKSADVAQITCAGMTDICSCVRTVALCIFLLCAPTTRQTSELLTAPESGLTHTGAPTSSSRR